MNILQDLLSVSGLSHVSKEITNVAQSSIRLKTYFAEETELTLGRTRFGGLPDLPHGKKWPTYNGSLLPFLAQINLSDVAAYDTDHFLPKKGVLSFFFDIDAFLGWSDDQDGTWCVWYTADFADMQYHANLDEFPKPREYRRSEVHCSTEITLPDYSSYDTDSVERLGLNNPLTTDEERAYHKIQAQLAGRDEKKHHVPLHRLLGYPDTIQWNMLSDLEDTGGNWRLLFQMDSDSIPDTDWGDTGRIYFWIREKELQQCNFSRAVLLLQS